MIQFKTHPYGTTRRATVIDVVGNSRMPAHVVRDEHDDVHVLTCGAEDTSAIIGNTGTLTFTNGGSLGGYWKFKKG